MTHLFTVTQQKFDLLKGQCRSLLYKDSTKFATDDTAIVQVEEVKDTGVDGKEGPLPTQREQLEFKIVSVEHGPGSKYINSHYCLIGLYAPYTAVDDVIDLNIGGKTL